MPFKVGLAKKRMKLLKDELDRIVPEIIELEVEKVILIGSLATNSIRKSSDIDLIIIKKTEKRFLDRLEFIYQHIKPATGIDILVYTPEEFEDMKQSNQFIRCALKNSRTLYEK